MLRVRTSRLLTCLPGDGSGSSCLSWSCWWSGAVVGPPEVPCPVAGLSPIPLTALMGIDDLSTRPGPIVEDPHRLVEILLIGVVIALDPARSEERRVGRECAH